MHTFKRNDVGIILSDFSLKAPIFWINVFTGAHSFRNTDDKNAKLCKRTRKAESFKERFKKIMLVKYC